jgi:hypothetical protein
MAEVIAAPQMKAVTVTTGNWGTLSGTFTSTGTLANQRTALETSFALSSASALMIYTNSYGGGTNANGSTTVLFPE